jgi:hypothetical protein
MSGAYIGKTLLRLVIAGPIVSALMKQDARKHRQCSLVSRWFFQIASLITLVLIAEPFIDRPMNYFDRFNTVVSADPSTIYQQYMRSQTWLDEQLRTGRLNKDLVNVTKTENEKIYKRISSIGNKLLYVRFGDIIDYADGSMEEPSFLYVTSLSANFIAWFMGAVLLTCYQLPPGGHLSILMLLVSLFALEMESRFISSDTLFGYMRFINENEWTVFEALRAFKEAMPGFVCSVIILASLFSGPGDTTKTLLRNLLRTNAGVVSILKDENLTQVNIDADETVSSPSMNLPHIIAKTVGALVLVNGVFRGSTE